MQRIPMVVVLLVVGVVAGWRAGGGCEQLRFFMGRLELAGDAGTMLQMIKECGLTVGAVRTALGWDYLFLACYGPLIAIVAAFAGRRLGGKWEYAGGTAAFASLTAAALDAIENAAMLHALEGRRGAALAAVAAVLKLVLVLPAALFAVVAVIGAAVAVLRAKPVPPLPAPADATEGAPALTCDVVMKGGITSGVVYPRAIARLSQEYRFVNVGGASAGAIAASATAAAEYARANGRAGFTVLEQLPGWLGGGGRLFSLFRPQPATRAPFEVFAAFLGHLPLPFKLARAFAAAIWHLPFAFLIGLIPGGLMAWAAFRAATPAFGAAGAVALTLVFMPLCLVVGLVLKVVRRLPRNGFGMCSGRLRGRVILSDWLAGLIDRTAGMQDRPLIFADLWTAGEKHDGVDQIREAARGRLAPDRKINFEALTTSLCHGRPYRMPDLRHSFYFRRADLEEVLPEYVVTWMVDHHGASKVDVPEGYFPLPEPQDLPVIFAARLSLSFPFLISAVKLWGIDWRRPANRAHKPGQPVTLDECWMSDGGIASNFPIHFFDALVPGRPTFGLDLQPFHADAQRDADESKNVFLPDNNQEGFQESWNHFRGVGGFIGALVDSIQAFFDNMQARAPGFRDRVARIYLDPEEGGLNLSMPPDVLARLGTRGDAAGEKIIERFVKARPSGWENHRWVRLRLLLGQLDPMLRHFARKMKDEPMPATPPSYAWREAGQSRLAEQMVAELIKIGDELSASPANLEDGSPRPVPELRIAPRV